MTCYMTTFVQDQLLFKYIIEYSPILLQTLLFDIHFYIIITLAFALFCTISISLSLISDFVENQLWWFIRMDPRAHILECLVTRGWHYLEGLGSVVLEQVCPGWRKYVTGNGLLKTKAQAIPSDSSSLLSPLSPLPSSFSPHSPLPSLSVSCLQIQMSSVTSPAPCHSV